MERKTLLQLVQDVLSDMNSDVVSNINETAESKQVTTIAKNVYYAMCDEYNLPGKIKLGKLDASAGDRPNYMKLPAGTKRLISLRYDCSVDTLDKVLYNELCFLEPEAFIDLVTTRLDVNGVVYVDDPASGVSLPILSDSFPKFYTSFDNEYIVFDSFNINVDTQLQNSKTLARLEYTSEFKLENDYKIDLPDHILSLYYNEVASNCFTTVKQVSNPKIEQANSRLRYNVQRHKDKVDLKPRRLAYGRR